MFEFSKFAAGGLLGRFLRDESGTSAIEYAIIAPAFPSSSSERSRPWALP